ncbi:hypothetical protein LTR85_011358 [Meristemomyces frigidus]|nr:hypothetical protein LTR85_011358 [Meristemomyces frigidus]
MSSPRTPRTPEEAAANEGARILQRMSQSGGPSSSSPSRPPRQSPSKMPTQHGGTPLEDPEEEEEARNMFMLWEAGYRAHNRTSLSGMLPSGARYSEATGRLKVPVAEYEHTGDEDDDEDDDSRYESAPASPINTAFMDTPPWRVGNPVRQPLLYNVPVAGGGSEQRRIAFMVDFDDAEDVAKANKARRLAVWREKPKLGMAVLRPGTRGRAYDQTHDDAIERIIDQYAALHNGALASYKQIHAEYTQQYPAENRTSASISSHIMKVPQLRAARASSSPPRTMRLFDLPTVLLGLLALNLPATIDATQHTSNWAVLVSTSRFWFNYRHMANTLSLYRTVKRLGIPDNQIILMLPDDMACNPRNTFAGSVFNDKSRDLDLYDQQKSNNEGGRPDVAGMGGIEVDYRGNEVTVENFIRLLTDRWPSSHPTSKRLMTDDRANILIYMTGHGGDSFLKFQDAEEISNHDLADAFEQMYEKKRYHEMLFMIDTCQANTMFTEFYSPGVIATGSSALDQSSYSHHADQDVGVAVIDRWTYFNLEFLETRLNSTSSDVRLGELFDFYTFDRVHSDAGVRYDLFAGGEQAARNRRVLDFFGNVQGVDVETGANGADGAGDWKADLEALKKITERSLAEMKMANGTESGVQSKPVNDHTAEGTVMAGGKVGAERVAVDMAGPGGAEGWAKKSLGAASLLALGAAWVVGSRVK